MQLLFEFLEHPQFLSLVHITISASVFGFLNVKLLCFCLSDVHVCTGMSGVFPLFTNILMQTFKLFYRGTAPER